MGCRTKLFAPSSLEAFKGKCRRRNAIEGMRSELARAHGRRRARYRGLDKVRLQNYFMGAACNAKRWIRRIAREMRQAKIGPPGFSAESQTWAIPCPTMIADEL
jgi:hypothetical protein